MDLLVVNLNEAAHDHVVLHSLCTCNCDYLAEGPRYDTTLLFTMRNPHHCKGLATS